MTIWLDQNGNQLALGDLMEGTCDECAGEPAFWSCCPDCGQEAQLCESCHAEPCGDLP